jgi:hypothetical protein
MGVMVGGGHDASAERDEPPLPLIVESLLFAFVPSVGRLTSGEAHEEAVVPSGRADVVSVLDMTRTGGLF